MGLPSRARSNVAQVNGASMASLSCAMSRRRAMRNASMRWICPRLSMRLIVLVLLATKWETWPVAILGILVIQCRHDEPANFVLELPAIARRAVPELRRKKGIHAQLPGKPDAFRLFALVLHGFASRSPLECC